MVQFETATRAGPVDLGSQGRADLRRYPLLFSRLNQWFTAVENAAGRGSKISLRAFGFVVRWIILAAVGLYSGAWIPQIADVSFAQLTLGQVCNATVGMCALGGVIAWAFREGEKSYDIWGWLGIVVLLLAVCWSRYISN